MTSAKGQSNLGFRLMSLEFFFRDRLRAPRGILCDAGVRPGMRVLDFGCGPGGFAIAAAEIVGTSGGVIAVDIHPLALQSVRRASERMALANVQVASAISAAALNDATIDFALLYDVLHDLEEPGTVLKEIGRVLRPEGILSVSDHHLSESNLVAMISRPGLYRFVSRTKTTCQFVRVQGGSSEI